MLYRYTTTGRRKAKIYTNIEHGITLRDIDSDAVKIIKKLGSAGYKAYLVGGAVRDLLLQREPKDFDIATNARPNRIRKIFRNSRIIGKRFKLVHIYCGKNKIIEVSTFRASYSDQGGNNIYGSLAEDALRRDFSLNALFYNPENEQIIDYVDGFNDIKKHVIRVLMSARKSFREDPVRIIRAVKYGSLLDFSIPFGVCRRIRRQRHEINSCSRERLTEEMYKILQSGNSRAILKQAFHLKLLEVLMPSLIPIFKRYRKNIDDSPLFGRLTEQDTYCKMKKNSERGKALAVLFLDLGFINSHWTREPLTSIQKSLRSMVYPLIPSNRDLKIATRIIKLSLKRKSKDVQSLQRSVSIR